MGTVGFLSPILHLAINNIRAAAFSMLTGQDVLIHFLQQQLRPKMSKLLHPFECTLVSIVTHTGTFIIIGDPNKQVKSIC